MANDDNPLENLFLQLVMVGAGIWCVGWLLKKAWEMFLAILPTLAVVLGVAAAVAGLVWAIKARSELGRKEREFLRRVEPELKALEGTLRTQEAALGKKGWEEEAARWERTMEKNTREKRGTE